MTGLKKRCGQLWKTMENQGVLNCLDVNVVFLLLLVISYCLLSLFIYLFVLFYLFYEVLRIFSETFHFQKCWRHRSLIKIFNFHHVNNSFSGFLDAPQMLNNNFSYLITQTSSLSEVCANNDDDDSIQIHSRIWIDIITIYLFIWHRQGHMFSKWQSIVTRTAKHQRLPHALPRQFPFMILFTSILGNSDMISVAMWQWINLSIICFT